MLTAYRDTIGELEAFNWSSFPLIFASIHEIPVAEFFLFFSLCAFFFLYHWLSNSKVCWNNFVFFVVFKNRLFLHFECFGVLFPPCPRVGRQLIPRQGFLRQACWGQRAHRKRQPYFKSRAAHISILVHVFYRMTEDKM